jgi:hypothetical protein
MIIILFCISVGKTARTLKSTQYFRFCKGDSALELVVSFVELRIMPIPMDFDNSGAVMRLAVAPVFAEISAP